MTRAKAAAAAATIFVVAAFAGGRGYHTPLPPGGPPTRSAVAAVNESSAPGPDDELFPAAIARAGGARTYGTTVSNRTSSGGLTVTDAYVDDGTTAARLAHHYRNQITAAGFNVETAQVEPDNSTTIQYTSTDDSSATLSIIRKTEPTGNPIVLVTFFFSSPPPKAQP